MFKKVKVVKDKENVVDGIVLVLKTVIHGGVLENTGKLNSAL